MAINEVGLALAIVLFAGLIVALIARRRQEPKAARRGGYLPPQWEDRQAAALASEVERGEVGEAHAAHFLDFVRLNQVDSATGSVAALARELPIIQEAVQWCAVHHRHRMVVDFMWALGPFLDATSRVVEEKQLLRQALSSALACHDQLAVAGFSHNLAMRLMEEGIDREALPLFEQSLRAEKDRRDRAGAANTLRHMAGIYERQGNTKKAAELRKKAERA